MSKHLTGLHKGEEIMIGDGYGRHWTDHGNDVFIDREIDGLVETDGFQVSERLPNNIRRRWTTNQTFEDALYLAERLVIGSNYYPPVSQKIKEPFPDLDVGDFVPGSVHLHALSSPQMKEYYEEDIVGQFEITKEMALGLDSNIALLPGKAALVVSINEEEDLMILYKYDLQFFTGVLKRKD